MPDTDLSVQSIEDCLAAYKKDIVDFLEMYDGLADQYRAAVRLLLKHQPKRKPREKKAK